MGDYISKINEKAERRFCATGIEMRAKDGAPTVFRGYAAKFNTLSNDLGGWKERIAPGFFDGVLADDVRALRDHSPSLILGRTTAGTCRIGVDAIGLWFEYDDPGTSYSRDLSISIGRQDVNQCSFAFCLPDGDDEDGCGDMIQQESDGSIIRTLLKCDQLFDVSVVTYPAYEDTTVAARSVGKFQIPKGIDVANELIEKELIDMDHRMMKLKF